MLPSQFKFVSSRPDVRKNKIRNYVFDNNIIKAEFLNLISVSIVRNMK
jgi:hypothetical protein